MLTCGDMQTIQVLLATVATHCSFREVVASLTVIKVGEFSTIDRPCLTKPWNSDAAVLGLVLDGLPFGRPALSAARTGPVVPAHSGDDQEQFEAEREFLEDALLRARRLGANPQALLPLSLPYARWRTDRARRASGGFAPS
ncbi:hypothetical protein A3723_05945 [Erythrobacter sp. HI0028]|jgi:hypothetical protein|nr:hypothetical protein A3723_05945 [Erythrobacter sp. HI0028]